MHSSSAAKTPTECEPELIGVDWGTSSCRAYLMGRAGRILEAVNTEKGILQVEGGAFAETLAELIGDWRRPGLPVILSGMIGSRQGWIEVPYVTIPATFDEIATALVRHPDDQDIYIAPGLAQDLPGQAPDVMRGEETQIIGAVGEASDRQLLVMPGTHSKWVLVENRKIVWFATFMTGELFAILKNHSILGRLMAIGDGEQSSRQDRSAFEQGLDATKTLPGGLLQHLFSARTLGLFERLPEDGVAPYLSGLLIGHELEEALGNLAASAGLPPITVVGASALAGRYVDALGHAALEARNAGEDMAAYGQGQLARVANLLSPLTG
ncbi:MAG: 2-dehydro-3-deoxygalactonokinase [Geminicoccaceae bacterium]